METYKLAELVNVNINSWVEALGQLDDEPEFRAEVLKEADEIARDRWRQMDECPAALEDEFTAVANRHNYRFDRDGMIISFDK